MRPPSFILADFIILILFVLMIPVITVVSFIIFALLILISLVHYIYTKLIGLLFPKKGAVGAAGGPENLQQYKHGGVIFPNGSSIKFDSTNPVDVNAYDYYLKIKKENAQI